MNVFPLIITHTFSIYYQLIYLKYCKDDSKTEFFSNFNFFLSLIKVLLFVLFVISSASIRPDTPAPTIIMSIPFNHI